MSSKVNTEVAYKFIRGKILDGKYAPGSALKSKRLAAAIGVSRTPIRDALRQLEADGLVVIRPRLGARVKELSLEEFSDLCKMRLALETYGAGLAAENRPPEEVAEIRDAVGAMETAGSKLSRRPHDFDAIHDFERHDLRFHLAILSAAKSQAIKREATRIHLLDQVFSGNLAAPAVADYRGEQWSRSLKEHRGILRAIEKGDVAGARRAMEEHLQPVVTRCLAALARKGRQRRATADNLKLIEA